MADAVGWFAQQDLSPLAGAPIRLLDLADPAAEREAATLVAGQAIIVGVDRAGQCPPVDPAPFDLLLTTAADPPAPWVAVDPIRAEATLATAVARAPIAASVLRMVLRVTARLPLAQAIAVESLAYSTLLGGAEFRRWLAARGPVAPPPAATGPAIRYARDGDDVTLTLDRPETRNATTAELRDALCEALANVADDPTVSPVTLRGAGRCFSTGGALHEFGRAQDLAVAHATRTLRSPALLLAGLGARAGVVQHGVSIGAGVEIAAAAAHRVATADASFQLPELAMGLIPGAGGTATVTRAIGRHRALWLMLTGRRIGARQALRWGLVHEIAA